MKVLFIEYFGLKEVVCMYGIIYDILNNYFWFKWKEI